MTNLGWIYRLHSDIDGDERFYIGSTNDIEERMEECEKNGVRVSRLVKEWISEIGDNLNYSIVAHFEDITEIYLKQQEDNEIVKYLRKDENCLNQRRAFVTEEERKEKDKERRRQWAEDNREYALERDRQWREDNKEYAQERDRQYYQNNRDKLITKVECPLCGRTVTQQCLAKHQKSAKCCRRRA